MPETIVLDPSEVATSRTQLDITPWVGEEGIDWGEAEIAAYMADQARGSSPVDFRVPNRTITIPLVLKNVGGTTFATARTNMQAKTALLQREGGYLKRLTSSGGTVFADVVNATLKLGGGWMQAHRSADPDAQLVIETLPDFYGAELTLPDHVTTTATELVFTETGIQGDYPARVRVVVDEDDADRQLGLIWGFRSRNYDAAATARLVYNGGTLTPQDVAAVAGTTMQHSTVSALWTPILNTNIVPTGALTHVGTYRVWAQIRSVGTTNRAVDVRMVWDVGDLSTPVVNTPMQIPGPDSVYTLDLGEVRIDRAPSGTHRWQGQIQAKAGTVPADIIIHKLWIVPVDDGYGVLRAPFGADLTFSVFAGRDEFDQTAGALVGKVLPIGGTWAGAGDADDFTVETTGHTAQRAAVTDAVFGRVALAGTANHTAIVVQSDYKLSALPAVGVDKVQAGVVARYVDSSNYLRGYMETTSGATRFVVEQVTGASSSIVLGFLPPLSKTGPVPPAPAQWWTVRLVVDEAGRWQLWAQPTGAASVMRVSGQTSSLATGGALASGRSGFTDFEAFGAGTITRNHDNFVAYVPTLDAVMHPSQSAELRWDGLYREDATGTSYGPVPFLVGNNPRLPAAGLEGRTCEVFIKGSRGDFDQLPDTATDDISARIFYRPCWLFVP